MKRSTRKQWKRLLERQLERQRQADELERQLDALPPELRPMRGGIAALIGTLTGNEGASDVAARYAFSETSAHLRRAKIRRVK